MKRLLEVVFGVNLVLSLFQQWVIPSVTNSVETFSKMDPIGITERLLKLAVSFMHLTYLLLNYKVNNTDSDESTNLIILMKPALKFG